MDTFLHSSGKEPSPKDLAVQRSLIDAGPIPTHVAVIMDGNGRWAEQRGRPRVFGHRAGVESVRDIVRASGQLGVKYLTLFTFSTENWQRPRNEVDALMHLLVMTTRKEVSELNENRVSLRAIGDLESLPEMARSELEDAIEMTSRNDGLVLSLAISYSGRWEIMQAVRSLARRVQRTDLDPDEINEDVISASLCTSGMPDPDLLIRTGGEVRISNFMLWQLAYAEIYITEVFWPDFRRNHLYDAVRSFQERERRFGRVPADESG